jgi:hypothetical protein
LFVNEVDTIGTALAGDFIDVATAVAWLTDIGVDLIPASSTIVSS